MPDNPRMIEINDPETGRVSFPENNLPVVRERKASNVHPINAAKLHWPTTVIVLNLPYDEVMTQLHAQLSFTNHSEATPLGKLEAAAWQPAPAEKLEEPKTTTNDDLSYEVLSNLPFTTIKKLTTYHWRLTHDSGQFVDYWPTNENWRVIGPVESETKKGFNKLVAYVKDLPPF